MRRTRLLQGFLLVLFFLVVFAYSFNPFKEPDGFYHLKTGQVIWQTKTVPHTDIYSYTATGAPWVTHEWLAEVVFYGVYAHLGYWGVMFFIALLALCTYYFVYRLARRPDIPLSFTFLWILLLGYLTFELWIPRPQVFAFLFCVLLIYLLERYRKEPRILCLIGSGAVMVAWANMHASFLLGLAIVGWYACAELLKRFKKEGLGPVMPNRAVRNLWLTVVAVGALGFLNPNTYKIFIYWQYVHQAAQVLPILEWKSILSFTNLAETKMALVQLTVSIGLAAYWFGLRAKSRDITVLGLVFAVSILPFIAIRHVGFWAIATIPFTVVALSGTLGSRLKKMPEIFLAGIFVAFAFLFILLRYPTFPRTYYNHYLIPSSAADFVERNDLRGPMFNLYNEGGYLIWRFWPQEKVAIDGRSEIYTGKPLHNFLDIVQTKPDWNTLVDDTYHVNYFFLAYNPPELFNNIKPLLTKLSEEGWPVVYWDDDIVIYARNVPENQDVLSRYALHYIYPFSDPTKIPPEYAKAAGVELSRVLEESPENRIVQDYAQRFLASHPSH